MVVAIAFVPLDKVVEHFEQLQERVSDAMIPNCRYFVDSCIGRPLHHSWSETMHRSSHTNCGICAHELMRSFHGLTVRLSVGRAVFRLVLVAVIQISGDS